MMGVLGNYDSPTKTWTPTPEFVAHLQNDPNGCGFKNADGTWKPAATIALLLVSPRGSVANPVAQPTIPKPFTIADLVAAAPNATRTIPDADLEPIAARCRDNDRAGVKNWADVLLARSAMSQAEHDAVVAVVEATEGDPSWQANVPGPSVLESTFGVGAVSAALISSVTGVA